MAEDDPFAKYITQPAAEEDPFAKYVEQKPGVLEDIKKAAVPSLERGGIALATTPRAISDLTGQGVNWVANKVAPQSVADAANRFHEADTGVGQYFPSYEKVKGAVERDLTGPMYEAQTGPGKAVQTGLEALPSLAAGGEGVVPTVGRAVGAGTLSGLLGSGVDYLKSKFPGAVPDWAEPVARAGGALVGGAVAPRAVTRHPMTPEQEASVAALKATHPEVAEGATAGQLTNHQPTMDLEARAPKFQAQNANQEKTFTDAAMSEMGSKGPFNSENLVKGEEVGKRIGQIHDTNEISVANFAPLQKEVAAAKTKFSNTAGAHNADSLKNIEDEIKFGAQGPNAASPGVYSMPGRRYEYLRGQLQGNINDAKGSEKTALSNVREALDNAYYKSLPDNGAELTKLQQQYANYKSLANIKPKMETTLSPKEVLSAVASSGGNKFANLDKGTLAPLTRNANSVMQPLKANNEVSSTQKLVNVLAGSVLGGGSDIIGGGTPFHALSDAIPLGGIFGSDIANPVINALRDVRGRVVASSPIQYYLKNQLWKQDANPKATMARLLAASPVRQQLPVPSQGGQ